MSMFPTITVCTDFSPGGLAAVERAAQLAMEHGAALCLLQAWEVGSLDGAGAPALADSLQRPGQVPALQARTSKLQQRLADSASTLALRLGLTVEIVLGFGAAHVVINEHIQSRRPTLVVLGSRFDPATVGLGGTVLKLLRDPGCPVLIVRKSHAKPYQQVMSAVDLRDGSVRAVVAALALFPQAHHHMLYAVSPALDSSLEAGGISAEQVQSLHETMYQNAERELQLLAQGLSTKALHAVSADVADDVPARALLVGAATLQADCIVVGHHDAETIGQSELGSMALHVTQFVPADVLVVP
ncbi:universal stress protein [Hydrogenophaga sp.]|uniref:universal stress protein n=1 Tax=Hydrogenophaga sp. TaxID=1904254 RepID=UPI003F7217D2